MPDKVDMSLDDIIKQTKGSGGGRGGSRGGRENRRTGGGGGDRQGTFRGGVQKSRSSGGRERYSRPAAMPDVWQHDMYEGGAGGGGGGAPARRQMSGGGGGGGASGRSGKLLISNLDFGVNDTDVKELFSEFGPIQKNAIHYDRSGRSLGTAEVIFERRSDAVKAMKTYNNVPLDGQAMQIQLVGADVERESTSSRLGARNDSGRDFGGGSGGGFGGNRNRRDDGGGFGGNRNRRGDTGRGSGGSRGRGRGGGGSGSNKKPMTAEELDAELDAYNAKMEQS